MIRAIAIALTAALLASCLRHTPQTAGGSCVMPDTLRVGMVYSPSSFFIYRGDTLGIDYDMAKSLAKSLGRPMKVVSARSQGQLMAMLDSQTIDLAASPLPITSETTGNILPVGQETLSHQVIVQRTEPGAEPGVTDVTDLPGKSVAVIGGSKYQQRLENLNQELGGGIDIIVLDADSVAPEDLIDRVADGTLPMALLDSDQARLHGGYHANINTEVTASLDQRNSWAVAPGNNCLADSINQWADGEQPQLQRIELLKQYYQLSQMDRLTYGKIDFSDGTISPKYDHLFRRYAPGINWDWRMLAAQAYTESAFNPRARSFAGARGLMQIMPRTGRSYGLRNPADPEQSVRAAVSYLDDLDRMFASKVPDPDERKKFVLAAYNAGQGHIFDAIRLASKQGLDPQVWDGNVAKAVLMLANPKHYNDNVVKYGYLRGRETFDYVDRITTLYSLSKTAIPV